MSSVKPSRGLVLVKVLPAEATLFQVEGNAPTTRGVIVDATGCYEEYAPGVIVFFQGGIRHDIEGMEHRLIAQGKILLYDVQGA